MVSKTFEWTIFAWQADMIAKEAKMLSATFITMSAIQSLPPSDTDSGQVISIQMQFLRKLCLS